LILKSELDLKKTISKLRNNKKIIGAMSGGYDLLHKGHQNAILFSSEQVDSLFVLVNSDSSIKKYKGETRPINSERNRLEELNSFNENNYYILFDELTPNNLLEIIKPNKYFISPEWSSSPVEMLVLNKLNTEVIKHPHLKKFSTSNLINSNTDFKGAIFLDRDGTINFDYGYIKNVENIKISKENFKGLENLNNLNFNIFIITNQSGVSKGLITKKEFEIVNNEILKLISKNSGRIDKTYVDFSDSRNPSKFRKPNIGMVEKAASEFKISLAKSWVVGDKDTDILLGKLCNMKTIYIENKMYKYNSILKPDFTCNDLLQASKIIKKFQY
jgi:D-glycero-D-manno-heptose 1,7-bisphosphate phosphatase